MRAQRFAIWRCCAACAARGKVGPVMGLRPLRGPPCIPPEAPPKRVFNFRKTARARGSSCGSFLPSLRSLRRSPSAPRKCHRELCVEWILFQPSTVEIFDRKNISRLPTKSDPAFLPFLQYKRFSSPFFTALLVFLLPFYVLSSRAAPYPRRGKTEAMRC